MSGLMFKEDVVFHNIITCLQYVCVCVLGGGGGSTVLIE